MDRLNISLDTLNPDLYQKITGKTDLEPLIQALRTAVAAGLPIKINTVVMRDVNHDEVDGLIDFCNRESVHTLKLLDVIQDLDDGGESYAKRLRILGADSLRQLYLPLDDIVRKLDTIAVQRLNVSQGGLGHPMVAFVLDSGLTVVVKDHTRGAWYGDLCNGCSHFPCHDALMALRMTADRRLQFCLLREDNTIDLDAALHESGSGLQAALAEALDIYNNTRFVSAQPTRSLRQVPEAKS